MVDSKAALLHGPQEKYGGLGDASKNIFLGALTKNTNADIFDDDECDSGGDGHLLIRIPHYYCLHPSVGDLDDSNGEGGTAG